MPWKMSDIIPNENNPRRLGEGAAARLRESIQRDPEFMALRPIIIDGDGMILGGNMRYRICQDMGYTELPDEWVQRAEGLTDEQRRRFILVDNAPEGMAGEWDWDILANEWEESELADLGFNLSDIEFGEEGTEGQTDADAVPEVDESEPPVSVPGEVYRLGEHRLMCGDSTSAEDVARLMNGATGDMVLTDPPYGVSYVGKTKDALEIENDRLDEDALTNLVREAFDHAEANCREGSYWYATVPPGPLHTLFAADWKRRGILRQIMVWAKDAMVPGRSEYHYQHEPILFGWMPGERHKNSDRTRTTLWKYDRPKSSRNHPTMKPVDLWAQAVRDGSRPGEIVYDPFLGSGTTMIACEQLGRACFGMEVTPKYCDIIRRRWAEYVHGEGCDWQALTPQDWQP